MSVESKTRLQSNSRLWFRMRTGRIMASRFKSACRTNPAQPFHQQLYVILKWLSLEVLLHHGVVNMSDVESSNIKSLLCISTIVQCQLFCTKKSYCDFVVWTESDIHIEHILPDEVFWHENVDHGKDFFVAAVLPELFGKFYSRPKQSVVSEEAEGQSSEDLACSSGESSVGGTSGDDLYCYCNKPEEGDMVGHDNPTCSYPECSIEKSMRRRKKWKKS